MSDEEGAAVENKRVDWLLERVEHRSLMFKLARIEAATAKSYRSIPPSSCSGCILSLHPLEARQVECPRCRG